jgi:hypothetical protein
MIFLQEKKKFTRYYFAQIEKNDDNQKTRTGVRNVNDINRNKTSVAAYMKLGVQV